MHTANSEPASSVNCCIHTRLVKTAFFNSRSLNTGQSGIVQLFRKVEAGQLRISVIKAEIRVILRWYFKVSKPTNSLHRHNKSKVIILTSFVRPLLLFLLIIILLLFIFPPSITVEVFMLYYVMLLFIFFLIIIIVLFLLLF